MANDPRQLIGGYITDTLTKTESDRLMQAALDDQDLFNEIMEHEKVRVTLADPAFRAELRAGLRQRLDAEGIPFLDRVKRLLFNPVVIPVGSFALFALVVLLVRNGVVSPNNELAQAVRNTPGGQLISAAGFFELRPGEPERLDQIRRTPSLRPGKARIDLDRGENASYRLGDALRLGFRVPENANVMVIEERADGSSVRLFPNGLQSSPAVNAGDNVVIPPTGQGSLSVDGPAGRRTLRVLIFPTTIDPMDFSRPWDQIQQQASVVTRTYEVKP